MNILGISGSTHDSSACLLLDGEIFMAIEEERLSRKKHAIGQKPLMAIDQLLKSAGLSPSKIDLVSYFISPKLFSKQAPIHIVFNDPKRYILQFKSYNTLNFLNRGERYLKDLDEIKKKTGITAPTEYVQHHLAHAACAYYLSGFEDAMILIVDNMGELDSTTLIYGKGKQLKILKTQRIPHSLGMFYAAITDYLGFKPWDEEGKVMALGAYGKEIIPLEEMVVIEDGSFKIKQPFQMIETKNHDRCYSNKLIQMFGPPRRNGDSITQMHKDIAASVQFAVEEVCKSLVIYMHKLTRSTRLCIAGGVGLNCKMNGELFKLPFIDEIFVPPAPGDNGSCLGAAIYSQVQRTGIVPKPLYTASLGIDYSDIMIRDAIQKSGLPFFKSKNIAKDAADLIIREGIIAWYQGKSEFGPRALGNRSILALPSRAATRDFINMHVKSRELWRPLCPSIIANKTVDYLKISSNGRFMNIAFEANTYAKARIPAVVHIDSTCRLQAVFPTESTLFYELLKIIGEITGDPVLLNTSFNSSGEPIVDSPLDALNSYSKMPINSLVMGEYIVKKNNEIWYK